VSVPARADGRACAPVAAGVQSQSYTVDRQMRATSAAHRLINKLDRAGANPERVTGSCGKLHLHTIRADPHRAEDRFKRG